REIARHRDTQRKSRRRSRLAHLAIVGYTNAGKSTLLNRLTDAGVLVEDRLFATVDPATRRLDLPGGERVLVSDTVGFVRKLPTQLVEAFRSTLEEVAEADLLVHVVDASAADPEAQMAAVDTVLREIGADEVPMLVAFNKADLVGPFGQGEEVKRLLDRHPGSVALSAVTGEGIDGLLEAVGERLRLLSRTVEMLVPYERGDVVAALHRQGEVLSEHHEEDATRLRVRLPDPDVNRYVDFLA
ncbi:MAG TPA: GTPase HflX, partial [Acidimicrobiales bacterium]